MIDVSNINLDTPVKIKIMNGAGTWIPELNTYAPVETYASVDQVCSILNRGISIDFPKQSSEKELTRKIEDILLDYREALNKVKKKNGFIEANDMDTALDILQEINDSVSPIELKEELNKTIFYYSDITNRILMDLNDAQMLKIFDSDDFVTSEERLDKQERMNAARKRVALYRKEACEYNQLEAETYERYSNGSEISQKMMDETCELNLKFTDFIDMKPKTKTNIKKKK